MSTLTGKERDIVAALSKVDLSGKVINVSGVGKLIGDLQTANQKTERSNNNLQIINKERKENNFFINWWNDTEDKVNDAQITLATSVADLNRHSSQLLIFNTAISKILVDQQETLLKQQKILEQQTKDLNNQNDKILEQQNKLEGQQGEIKIANKGLLETKGVTAEQARKLVGCVQRVESAEHRINDAFTTIDQRITDIREGFYSSLRIAIKEFNERDKKIVQWQQEMLEQQTKNLNNQNNKILEQQKKLEEQQEEIKIATEGLLEVKGVTAEQAVKLVDYVQQVESVEHRINNTFNTIDQRITDIREGFDSSLRIATEEFDERDKKIIQYIKKQQQQIEDHSKSHQELINSTQSFGDMLISEQEKQFTQRFIPISQSTTKMESRLNSSIQRQEIMIRRFTWSLVTMGVLLLGIGSTHFFL